MADNVKFSGPLFDGSAAQALADGINAMRKDIADEGQRLTRSVFAGMIRRPSGRFDGSITTTRSSTVYSSSSGRRAYSMPVVVEDPATDTVVTTDLATYGPWLEGTGSRNESTRFKGYHGFRAAAGELDGHAEELAEQSLQPYIERCN